MQQVHTSKLQPARMVCQDLLFFIVQASVTCALTGPLQIKDYKAISGPQGHEVFSERKGLSLFQNKVNKSEICILLKQQWY